MNVDQNYETVYYCQGTKNNNNATPRLISKADISLCQIVSIEQLYKFLSIK